MASMRNRQTQDLQLLAALTKVGRAGSSDVVLTDGLVSSHHAELRWTGSHWELRDLDSRNGTTLNGRRLAAGERARLAVSDVLAFGGPDLGFVLESDTAPTAVAVPVDGGDPVEATGGMLALPDPQTPTLTIYCAVNGTWVMEHEGQVQPLDDGARVAAGGATWRLSLPEIVGSTLDGGEAEAQMCTTDIGLHFRVSLDEETTDVLLVVGAETLAVPRRVHHYLLLTLARARITDAEAHPKRPIDHGWVHVDELMQMLMVTENQLNLQIYRARKQLAGLGLEDAANLVERQPTLRTLRLGVSDCRVLS
jgi:hypothetical protein